MNPERIETELQAHVDVLKRTVSKSGPLFGELVRCLCDCFQRGNKLLLCGNGGSAADAQHVAGEFVNRFRFNREALPAIALTTDTSILTCVGNDASFEEVFSRQVQALGAKGDVLVGISTSGRSANVLKALDAARSRNLLTIGFTGARGRETLGPKCDFCFAVASDDTPRIQEAHEFAWHFICGAVEARLFAHGPGAAGTAAHS
jgi:D-sedoheptulose 7-phosphate isomerase